MKKMGKKMGKKVEKKIEKKIVWMGLCLGLCLLPCFLPYMESQAASKISSLKLKFEVAGTDQDGIPIMEAEGSDDKYTVNGVMTMEEYAREWSSWEYSDIEDIYSADYDSVFDESDEDGEEDEVRRIDTALLKWNRTYRAIGDLSNIAYVAELEAADGYYFTNNTEKMKLSGCGADLVQLERLEKKKILVLYIRFSELDDRVQQVEKVEWTGEGTAAWSSMSGASYYEVRLGYDGKKTGSKITGGTTYDFCPLMQKSGTYFCEVRAVSATGDVGEWKTSGSILVSEEVAKENRQKYLVKAVPSEDGSISPVSCTYQNVGWRQTEDGRFWYQETDGSYLQQNWLLYGGYWYFFDENGYMNKETYIRWGNAVYYLNAEGHMITEGRAPDGRIAAADGTLSWPAY